MRSLSQGGLSSLSASVKQRTRMPKAAECDEFPRVGRGRPRGARAACRRFGARSRRGTRVDAFSEA
eukprot:3115272-Lingulodinium_polyedra.AAC.1